jgi:glyoxylase-like metal-dependent hydrolase (beta-lactamase superfamily II)
MFLELSWNHADDPVGIRAKPIISKKEKDYGQLDMQQMRLYPECGHTPGQMSFLQERVFICG